MSKSVNTTLIGTFVVGALFLLVLAVLIFGSGALFKKQRQFVILFDTSISGLSIGAPVVFRGVPVGRVANITLAGDMKDLMFTTPVYIDLDQSQAFEDNSSDILESEQLDLLAKHGFRARLASQSLLTGQLMIELDFFNEKETGPQINAIPFYKGIPQILVIPSRIENVWRRFDTLPLDEIAQNILAITKDVKELSAQAMKNQVGQHFAATLNDAQVLLTTLNTVGDNANAAINEFRTMAHQTNLALPDTTKQLNKLLEHLDSTITETEKTVKAFRVSVDPTNSTMLELRRSLSEITEAARAVRGLATTLERNPESLLRGKGTR